MGYKNAELRLGKNDTPLDDPRAGEVALRIDSTGAIYTKPEGSAEIVIPTAATTAAEFYPKSDFSASPVAAEPLKADGSGGIQLNGNLTVTNSGKIILDGNANILWGGAANSYPRLFGTGTGGGSAVSFYLNSTPRLRIGANGVSVGTTSLPTGTQFLVDAEISTNIGQVIKLAAAQTANAFEVQDSTAAVLASFSNTGTLSIAEVGGVAGISMGFGGSLAFTNSIGSDYVIQRDGVDRIRLFDAATTISNRTSIGGYSTDSQLTVIGIGDRIQNIVRGFSTQTANIFEVQDSAAAVLASIDASGQGTFPKLKLGAPAVGGVAIDAYSGTAGTSFATMQWGAAANGNALLNLVLGNTVTGIVDVFKVSGNATTSLQALVQQNGNGKAKYVARVIGTGDAQFQAEINGGQTWSFGLDNSDGGKFKFSNGTTLGTNDRIEINQTGAVTVLPGNASYIGQVIKLAAAQTANAFEVQSSATTVLASIDASGGATFPLIGVGTAPIATAAINITKSFSVSGSNNGIRIQPSQTVAASSITGLYANIIHSPATGTTTTGTAISGIMNHTGSGSTLTNAIGVTASITNLSTGTISGAYGVRVFSVANSGGGTVNNAYGLQIDSQTAGAVSNYAIYTNLGLVSLGDVLFLRTIKSGATQAAAGAAANEVWKTASHATLPDNVLLIGV